MQAYLAVRRMQLSLILIMTIFCPICRGKIGGVAGVDFKLRTRRPFNCTVVYIDDLESFRKLPHITFVALLVHREDDKAISIYAIRGGREYNISTNAPIQSRGYTLIQYEALRMFFYYDYAREVSIYELIPDQGLVKRPSIPIHTPVKSFIIARGHGNVLYNARTCMSLDNRRKMERECASCNMTYDDELVPFSGFFCLNDGKEFKKIERGGDERHYMHAFRYQNCLYFHVADYYFTYLTRIRYPSIGVVSYMGDANADFYHWKQYTLSKWRLDFPRLPAYCLLAKRLKLYEMQFFDDRWTNNYVCERENLTVRPMGLFDTTDFTTAPPQTVRLLPDLTTLKTTTSTTTRTTTTTKRTTSTTSTSTTTTTTSTTTPVATTATVPDEVDEDQTVVVEPVKVAPVTTPKPIAKKRIPTNKPPFGICIDPSSMTPFLVGVVIFNAVLVAAFLVLRYLSQQGAKMRARHRSRSYIETNETVADSATTHSAYTVN